MQDTIGFPACFSSAEKPSDDLTAVNRSGQTVFMSVFRTKIADQCRLVTVTWCKNLLLHCLSVSVEGPQGEKQYGCKVELKPWCFWRKQGSKHFVIDGNIPVVVFWDLKAAKFNGQTQPISEYYVAVVCNEEVVLVAGDLKKKAYRKTGCMPALIDPILVSRKEHIFGKKRFSTRVKFHEKGGFHDISIECKNRNVDSLHGAIAVEPEMEMRIDGNLALHVQHLQWKFRGNESINVNKRRLQVYWDVHDWLFSPGLTHALFIFKPALSSSSSSPLSSSSSQTGSSSSSKGLNHGVSSEFCLFLYAWKIE